MMSEMPTAAANGQVSSLPALSGNMPQWSRINTLDKGRPRHIMKDSHESAPLPQTSGMTLTNNSIQSEPIESSNLVTHLEKNISFLRKQHNDVLASLHSEIDVLKRDNKDLQFNLIMLNKSPTANIVDNKKAVVKPIEQIHDKIVQRSSETNEEFTKVKQLEEELIKIKLSLSDEKSKNHYLSSMIEKKRDLPEELSCSAKSPLPEIERKPSASSSSSNAKSLPFNARLEPTLLVTDTHDRQRPPTLPECHVIIKYLRRLGEDREDELNTLKSNLRDVIYSQKWTPDAYLMAKAYISESMDHRILKQPSKKLPDIAYIPKEVIALPALKHTLGNKAVERKRRTQILQKARLRRDIFN